jgi:pSer/pThr/pTyr-binding forkhead associated (FHA) protein
LPDIIQFQAAAAQVSAEVEGVAQEERAAGTTPRLLTRFLAMTATALRLRQDDYQWRRLEMTTTPHIMVQLIHIHGSLKGEIQEFFQTPISVGRLSSCSVRFPADEPGVSREHARIEREGNQFKLTDLSRFGTLVNGKQVQEVFLRSGDVMEFGPGGPKASITMEIVASLPLTAAVSQAAAAPEPRPLTMVPAAAPLPDPGVTAPRAASPVVAISKTVAPLVIQFGPTLRTYRELPIIVGSHSGADFVLNHPGISDQHAQLFFHLDCYWVKDLTGQGLLRVNRMPVEDPLRLCANDEIECSPEGPVFRFLGEGRLAEVEQAEAQAEPTLPDQKLAETANRADSNFFSRLAKGFKKQ